MAISALILLVAVPINLAVTATDPGEYASWREIGRHLRFTQFLDTMVGVLTSLGLAKIVEQRLAGKKMGFRGGLIHALRRWLPSIGTGLIEAIILLFLLLALVVPGIIWSGYYAFSRPVVSLRGRAGKAALDYSKSLVRGRWWGVISRIVGLGIIALLPGIIFEIAISFGPYYPATSFASALVTSLGLGFVTVATTVLFLNLEAVQRGGQVLDVPAPRL